MGLPVYNGHDWNGALGRADTLPIDRRKFFIVTDDIEVVQVQFDDEASFWMPSTQWADIDDPERGRRFDASEIMGWTENEEVAEDAAAQFEEFFL